MQDLLDVFLELSERLLVECMDVAVHEEVDLVGDDSRYEGRGGGRLRLKTLHVPLEEVLDEQLLHVLSLLLLLIHAHARLLLLLGHGIAQTQCLEG